MITYSGQVGSERTCPDMNIQPAAVVAGITYASLHVEAMSVVGDWTQVVLYGCGTYKASGHLDGQRRSTGGYRKADGFGRCEGIFKKKSFAKLKHKRKTKFTKNRY